MSDISVIVTAPTVERGLRGPVELFPRAIQDIDGRPSQPYRSVEVLEQLARRGVIDERQREAGERFQADFARAQIDPLRASDWSRPIGSGIGPADKSLRALYSADSVWKAMVAVGGGAPASCLWNVIGWGKSINAWCHETTPIRHPQEGRGILIAALSALAAYYKL